MEYAKDEVFSICYGEKKDKLKESYLRKALRNKFMIVLIILGITFSILNITLIYMFFDVLSKI